MRAALGLQNGNGLKAHHIIPVELLDRGPVQAALEAGFEFNGKANGKGVSANVHNALHNDIGWNKNVANIVDKWGQDNKGYTPEQARTFIEGLANTLGKGIPKE